MARIVTNQTYQELQSRSHHLSLLEDQLHEAVMVIEQLDKNPHYEVEINEEWKDQFPFLNKIRNLGRKLAVLAQQESERSWASEGIAITGKILRNHSGTKEFYDRLISHIVKYVNANQGSFFVIEQKDKERYLKLEACYAYEKKKYIQKEIPAGEGLLGQCLLEKEYTLLTKTPENYVHITSGLGYALPRCLLIIPFKFNDEVFAIAELATFYPFKPYQIEFLEKIGESIASAILNLKSSVEMQLLLSNSIRQSDELKAQEEEMRQSLEELTATQEEMARKNDEIINLLEEYKKNELLLKEKATEIERMKIQEAERMEAIQANQRSILEKAMQRFKAKEEGYQLRIKELETNAVPGLRSN